MKLDVRSTFAQIRFDQEKDAHVVVSLTAPSLDESTPRPAICIIPCIDISGSMSGSKIDFAKRSVLKLIDHLKPTDYCGVVAFESSVYDIARPEQLANGTKDKIKNAVSKLGPRGGTNFSGGLLRALELIKDLDLPEGTILRVIMFTDGQANEGVAVKTDQLVKLLEANRGRVTVSAFGYGAGADQALLTAFSTAGKGNYAFIAEPDAALSAFGTELGGLLSTYATDLEIEVVPLNGHQITEVVSDVAAEQENTGEVTIKVPDILAEEVRHLVLAVKFAEQKQAFPRQVNTFDVKLTYATITADGKKDRKTLEAKAKVQFVKEGEQQDKPDTSLDQIVGLAQLVRAQVKAEEAAKAGNYAEAQAAMFNFCEDAASRGLDNVANLGRNVRRRMSNSQVYAQNQGYLRSAQAGATRGMGVVSYDSVALNDVRAAGVVTSNSTQQQTSGSFVGSSVVTPEPLPVVEPFNTFTPPNVSARPILTPLVVGSPTPADPSAVPYVVVQAPSVENSPPEPEKAEEKPARKLIKQTRSKRAW